MNGRRSMRSAAMMKEQSKRPAAAELERLALLVNGLGQAQRAVGKILLFGYEARDLRGGSTNRQVLEKELGDLYHAILALTSAGDVRGTAITHHSEEKSRTVAQDLRHQAPPGPHGGPK